MKAPAARLCRRNCLLALAGLLSLVVFAPAYHSLQAGKVNGFLGIAGAQAILCFVAARCVWNASWANSTFFIVLAFAGALRAPLLFEPPILSDDMYRYIWDGRVQAAGINPYRYIPAESKLLLLRDEKIYPNINRREYAHTIYPPVAQISFYAITRLSETVTWFKLALLCCEGVTIWALARLLVSFGLPRERLIVYAWNPLVLWEFSGSGHIDAILITFMILAVLARLRGRDALTGLLLSLAILIKFFPIVLFPALYRRWNWKMPIAALVVICAGYSLYLSVGPKVFGFLSTYAGEEDIGGGRFFLLLLVRYILGGREISVLLYFVAAGLALATLAGFALLRWDKQKNRFLFAAGALAFVFSFLLSPKYAWYWTWVVPFLAFLPWRLLLPFFYVTVAALVQYGTWFDKWNCLGMNPHLALGLLQFGPFILWIAILARAGWHERGSPFQSAGDFGRAVLFQDADEPISSAIAVGASSGSR